MEACLSCGKELPGEFPFCPFCGATLRAQTAAPAAEERKVVSVLFCDLVGFTASSEQADPEDVRARLRPYHERVRDVLERHGGTVEKFIGDAVMAVFGAPVTHEDDAERAVRAGLRILEAIGELNDAEPGLSLQVRVGVNTGEAVVSLSARPELGEAMVTGDVVNTASRLQGAAPVDGVAVSDQTFRATERVFDWERLDAVQVKGKADPLRIWRPLAARARFGSDITRTHATPLVGRELEKRLLFGTFERAAQQQSCQLITIVGEPGVGKSRLCMELFAYLEQRPGLVRWRQGRCLPYGDGISFWALGEIVKAECGILETDTPEQAALKLEQTVPADERDRAWLVARLAPLVGVPGEPASQEESFTAWRRFLEHLSAHAPAVFVFEDLHWADPALLTFLEHLADWAEGVPMLVLCTARPELHEHHRNWAAGLRNATTINLAPLTDEETALLVSALLERAVLPAETQQQLLERAGGNPLYAEEFVRLLADRGGAGEVPESVQALIAARLDTLSPQRKSLLQDAAVMGKTFWVGTLAQIGDRDTLDVEQALHELSRKELVRPARASSMQGEQEYSFWHGLVRDVCYSQIPRAGRATRHQAVAAWLEDKAGERVEDLADVLAHHYLTALELPEATNGETTADLRERAIHYLALAGERALDLDTDQAERTLARALGLALDDDPQRPRLLERWAQALQQQSRVREARDALEHALVVHRRRSDRLAAGRTLTHLSLIHARLGEPSDALREALELLEAEPPGPELVVAYTRQAALLWLEGAAEEAVVAARKALDLAASIGMPRPAAALGSLGLARVDLGEREGAEQARRALDLAIEQGEGRPAGVLYNNLAYLAWTYEGPRSAAELIREGIEFARRRGLTDIGAMLASNLVSTLADLGQIDEALESVGRYADQVEQTGDIHSVEDRSLQIRLLCERGEHAQASDSQRILQTARTTGWPQHMASALAAAALLHLARQQPEQAGSLLAELDRTASVRTDTAYAWLLPHVVRCAVALDDADLASRLLAGVPGLTPLQQHAIVAAEATLAEKIGNHIDAVALYADAAQRWEQFGNVPERAYALLGQGRCLHHLDDPAADQQLIDARELFAAMGYQPALAVTQAVLDQRQRAAS